MSARWSMLAPVAAALGACGGGGSGAADEATAQRSAIENAGAGGTTPPVAGSAPATMQTPSNAQQYVALAAAGDLFEIESARIAQQKSQRPDVRQFAAMILADHQRSSAELARAAGQVRPAISAPPVLSAEQQANLQALGTANGRAFDIVYLRQQVIAHEQALNLVTSYASSGEVEPLRRHAASVAEPIRRHLARARELEVPAPNN